MKRTRLLRYLLLPPEISQVERRYLAEVNRVGLVYLLLHFPVLIGVAALRGTGVGLAATLTVLTLVGPAIAYFTFSNPRHISVVFGITGMLLGGLLVHFGSGPMQIEMHFLFFISLALLAVFANPLVVIVAAATVAVHHLLLYVLLPASLFNYAASLWTVAVHALFVVIESVAVCFVARTFFDNVIGLERKVAARTAQLAARTDELRLLLDSMGQGFLTADFAGVVAAERSRIVSSWFGESASGAHVWDLFGAVDPEFAGALKTGWENLGDGILPIADILTVLPTRLVAGDRQLECQYRQVTAGGLASSALLIVVTDVTLQLEHQNFERDQQELLGVFKSLRSDPAGFAEFIAEAKGLLAILQREGLAAHEHARALHTLKGNARLFGLASVAACCQRLEEQLAEGNAPLEAAQWRELSRIWEAAEARIAELFAEGGSDRLTVAEADYLEVKAALRSGAAPAEVLALLEGWREEAAATRLGRIADQARALAARLGKGPLEVSVRADRVRLPRDEWAEFWSVLVHVIRNAVDHGVEDSAVRQALGKPPQGRMALDLKAVGDELSLTVADDGPGVDWEKLRQAARAAKLPADTRSHLIQALLSDGITTREVVTETSGRGVGMSAVQATCQRMGGTLHVESEPGLGTCFEFRFPAAKATRPPAAGVAAPGPLLGGEPGVSRAQPALLAKAS